MTTRYKTYLTAFTIAGASACTLSACAAKNTSMQYAMAPSKAGVAMERNYQNGETYEVNAENDFVDT